MSEAIVVTDHDTCNKPRARRKRAVFPGVGGKFVENQRQADRKLGRKKQRIAVQGEPDMAIRSEFGAQQIPDSQPLPSTRAIRSSVADSARMR